jgi:hypothetical protein
VKNPVWHFVFPIDNANFSMANVGLRPKSLVAHLSLGFLLAQQNMHPLGTPQEFPSLHFIFLHIAVVTSFISLPHN